MEEDEEDIDDSHSLAPSDNLSEHGEEQAGLGKPVLASGALGRMCWQLKKRGWSAKRHVFITCRGLFQNSSLLLMWQDAGQGLEENPRRPDLSSGKQL